MKVRKYDVSNYYLYENGNIKIKIMHLQVTNTQKSGKMFRKIINILTIIYSTYINRHWNMLNVE